MDNIHKAGCIFSLARTKPKSQTFSFQIDNPPILLKLSFNVLQLGLKLPNLPSMKLLK